MILSDVEIRKLIEEGKIRIEPFYEDSLDDVSYEVHLGDEFAMMDYTETPYIDVKDLSKVKWKRIKANEIVIQPHHFILARTLEWIELPEDITVLISGKSSLARLGLQVHAAALIHPGSRGYQVLELYNMNNVPIVVRKGMEIAQMIFIKNRKPSKDYSFWGKGKYWNQRGIIFPEKIDFVRDL